MMFSQNMDSRQVQALNLLHRVRVNFAGFESTVGRLMGSGWQFHSEQDHFGYRLRLVLLYPGLKIGGFLPDVDFMQRRPEHFLNIEHVTGHDMKFMHVQGKMPEFRMLEAGLAPHLPDTFHSETFCLADCLQHKSANELLIAPEDETSVDDLLGHILSKQTDLREQIARRRLSQESIIERPTAQIIKLFAS